MREETGGLGDDEAQRRSGLTATDGWSVHSAMEVDFVVQPQPIAEGLRSHAPRSTRGRGGRGSGARRVRGDVSSSSHSSSSLSLSQLPRDRMTANANERAKHCSTRHDEGVNAQLTT